MQSIIRELMGDREVGRERTTERSLRRVHGLSAEEAHELSRAYSSGEISAEAYLEYAQTLSNKGKRD